MEKQQKEGFFRQDRMRIKKRTKEKTFVRNAICPTIPRELLLSSALLCFIGN